MMIRFWWFGDDFDDIADMYTILMMILKEHLLPSFNDKIETIKNIKEWETFRYISYKKKLSLKMLLLFGS